MWFLWGIICQRFQIEITHQRNASGKKAVFMSYVWLTILFLYQNERPYWKKSQVTRPYCVRGLKEHTSRVQEGTKPFLCDSCEALKLNIKGMLGGKKPFSCPMCGSQFYFSTRMKDHIEKESKIARPYCVRGLKEHTSRVHEGTKPFLCDTCEE